jgi:hypothetical protein
MGPLALLYVFVMRLFVFLIMLCNMICKGLHAASEVLTSCEVRETFDWFVRLLNYYFNGAPEIKA